MKKFLLVIALAIIVLPSFAQSNFYYQPVTIELSGGNAAFFNCKLLGSGASNLAIFSPSLGINVDTRINDYFSIRPGLLYTGKGGAIQFNRPGVTSFNRFNQQFDLNYLEMPISIIGHVSCNDEFNILIGAGPYAAIGITAKSVITIDNTNPDSEKFTFRNDGNFKLNDFGATLLFGFETLRGLIVTINYDMGLTNIAQNSGPSNNVKTGAIYTSIGLSFE